MEGAKHQMPDDSHRAIVAPRQPVWDAVSEGTQCPNYTAAPVRRFTMYVAKNRRARQVPVRWDRRDRAKVPDGSYALQPRAEFSTDA